MAGFLKSVRRRLHERMRWALAKTSPNREYEAMPKPLQAFVDVARIRVGDTGCRQSIFTSSGYEVYAYPAGGGRISWGVNSEAGDNIARGVFPAEQEMAS